MSTQIPDEWLTLYNRCQRIIDGEDMGGQIDYDANTVSCLIRHIAFLTERAERAEAQVAAYEWIPVSERLPDTRGELGHSTSVLIWNPDCECVFMAVRREDEGWEDWTNGQHKHSESEITHWLPSPEPPSIPPPMPTEGGKSV